MGEAIVAGELLLNLHSNAGNTPVPDDLSNTLFNAMIVAYARPFTENEGLGSIQNDFKTFPSWDPDKHSRLMQLRHNFGSHSSVDSIGFMVFSEPPSHPGEPCTPDNLHYVFGKRRFHTPQFVEWLLPQPRNFRSFLFDEFEKLLDQHFLGKDLSRSYSFGEAQNDYVWDKPKTSM